MRCVLSCAVVLACFSGCGPMRGPSPLPERLDEQGQKSIDESWNQALSPVTHLDHKALLDGLLVTQAYQFGVDKMLFRSEKKFAGGTVVMELEFDRQKPEQDRLEVNIFDANQVRVRQEKYKRDEIEKSVQDLFTRHGELQTKVNNGQATPEEAKELGQLNARHEAIAKIFPQQNEKEKVKDAPGNR